MIVFKNEGLIPVEAFTHFGVNAKPNSSNPIGYFGTGLKIAIAVITRLGGTVKLWRGTEEYEFYTKDMKFRDKEFQTVRMRKRKGLLSQWRYESLPFTTELGKHWEPWMAYRELEANCRDENGSSWICDDDAPIAAAEGVTAIAVLCPEVERAAQFEQVFLPLKPKVLENSMLEIYEGESRFIYYRGLRVTDLQRPSKFTYNFTLGVTLTEDRTSKYPWVDAHHIMETYLRSTDQKLVEKILDLDEYWYEHDLPFDTPYVEPAATFRGVVGHRMSLGGHVPARVGTWYKKRQAEDDPEYKVSVKLSISDVKELIDNFDPGSSIHRAAREALADLGLTTF